MVLVLIGTRVDVEIVVVGVLEICTGGGVVVLEKLLERGVDKLGRLVDKFILLVVDGEIEEEEEVTDSSVVDGIVVLLGRGVDKLDAVVDGSVEEEITGSSLVERIAVEDLLGMGVDKLEGLLVVDGKVDEMEEVTGSTVDRGREDSASVVVVGTVTEEKVEKGEFDSLSGFEDEDTGIVGVEEEKSSGGPVVVVELIGPAVELLKVTTASGESVDWAFVLPEWKISTQDC